MRLVRYEREGAADIGAVVGEGVIAIRRIMPEIASIRQLAGAGHDTLARLRDAVDRASPDAALSAVRLLAPIERPHKYLAIGMNYAKHLEEADKLGVPRAKFQTWFNKQTSCIVGPFDEVLPGNTEKLDYEVELGVVIGSPAKNVTAEQASAHVFGYFVANDVSARDYQFHTSTFTMGKSFDTHGPIGPWIVTADEIADPHALALRCLVNGELRQSSNTGCMIANVWAQVAYLSSAFTLETGDLIATGTPDGVGIGMDPPRFLQAGDVVRCEIDGIGAIENKVVAR